MKTETPPKPVVFVEGTGYDLINASLALDEPIVVSYNMAEQAQMLHYNKLSANVDFGYTVTSVAFDKDSDVIWINGGSILKSFDARDLSSLCEINTEKRSSKSAMLFWKGNLVAASGSTIQCWSRSMITGEDTPSPKCLTLLLPSITALATVSGFLVVASSEYHTAQVYADNGASVHRAIGHTAGVTALHGFDENCFISGSADQTVKLWDLRDQWPVVNMVRHRGIVTAVYGDARVDRNLILSGGTDGMIKGWDWRNMKPLFSVSAGQATPQSIHCVDNRLTVVVSERAGDAYYDMEKFGKVTQVADNPPNAVLTYRFPVE